MLTKIREKATGWIAWVIIILLAIPFALFGINSYFEGDSQLNVAQVNGEGIPIDSYQQSLSEQQRLLSQRLGDNFDITLLDRLGIKDQVLNGLIENVLFNQYVKDENFTISDKYLEQQIKAIPLFQENGQFSQNRYENLLLNNRISPTEFEQSQRTAFVIDQLRQGIVSSGFVLDSELNSLLKQKEQTRSVEYIEFKVAEISDQFEVSDQEVNDYFSRNATDFYTQPKMKVEYIDISIEKLKPSIQPQEDEILAHYENTRGRYRNPETRSASHILIHVPQDAEDSVKTEKRALAEELVKRADTGEKFSVLAKQYSDDPGSKDKAGDLGVITRGQMPKPFEDTLFSMALDQISRPIKTPFGYHIIKLTRLIEGSEKPLQLVRQQVVKDLKEEQAELLFHEKVEHFKNLVFEEPDSLSITADELELQIEESPWFTQTSGAGLFSNFAIREAAFSEDVLVENLVSPALELAFDHYIAIQKLQYEDAAIKPLTEVEDQIIAVLQKQKAKDSIHQTVAKLTEKLDSINNSKADWDGVLLSQGMSPIKQSWKKEDVPAFLSEFGARLFSTSPPENGEYTYDSVNLASGDMIVFALTEVKENNLSNVDEADKSTMQRMLQAREGLGTLAQFSGYLKDMSEIVIYEDRRESSNYDLY